MVVSGVVGGWWLVGVVGVVCVWLVVVGWLVGVVSGGGGGGEWLVVVWWCGW